MYITLYRQMKNPQCPLQRQVIEDVMDTIWELETPVSPSLLTTAQLADLDSQIADLSCEVQEYGSASLFGKPYYSQSHEAFLKFYEDVEDVRFEWEEKSGKQITINGDLMDFLINFAYGVTALDLFEVLENADEEWEDNVDDLE